MRYSPLFRHYHNASDVAMHAYLVRRVHVRSCSHNSDNMNNNTNYDRNKLLSKKIYFKKGGKCIYTDDINAQLASYICNIYNNSNFRKRHA